MNILLVDDEEMILEFLKRSLIQDGHTVDTSSDGLEAFRKASENKYDAIILDVIMPSKNGVEVCAELRENGMTTPILMLSSRDSEEAKVQGLTAGADDYMTKPFGYSELAARIEAICRRSSTSSNKELELKELVILPAARRVQLNEEPIHLTPKEYDLLKCLMSNSGIAVSKAQLLSEVWGVSAKNASTRLQVCIKSVREKIGTEGPAIRCVRGFGYIIE